MRADKVLLFFTGQAPFDAGWRDVIRVGAATSLLLLPGQYSSTTNPQLLHDILTSSSASLSPSPGFPSSVSLPLNLALQPGFAAYPVANYSGQAVFTQLPSTPVTSNSSTQSSAGAFALSSNVWVALSSGSNNDRVIFWDSVPDVSQLPSGSPGSTFSILDIQSSACSPPCTGAGVCSASGTCTCPTGFNGTSCESCAAGFFGSTCQACPAGCQSCDDGISGSGRCLAPIVSDLPSSCNCLNGVCGSNGECTCNAGWTTADNGTACAKCEQGFFLDSSGNCEVCQLGCTQCADGTGDCISCSSEFTQSANDPTQCLLPPSTTSSGTTCPDTAFSNGTACVPCSPLCQTCTGASSSDCVICGAGKYTLNGSCVSTDGNGVCENSNLIANNNKHECDSCPAKCTTCKIPNFTVASTINQAQCTGCLPGFVLSQGECIESCPSGTFLSPQDNLTCTGALRLIVQYVRGIIHVLLDLCEQPTGIGWQVCRILPLHHFQLLRVVHHLPPRLRNLHRQLIQPVLELLRQPPRAHQWAMPPHMQPVTVLRQDVLDVSSMRLELLELFQCGPKQLSRVRELHAGPARRHLRLRYLFQFDKRRPGSRPVPLRPRRGTPHGLGHECQHAPSLHHWHQTPTTNTTSTSSGRALAWWEILLMALGCAFIFVIVLMLWRRRARKRRAQATAQFATAKRIAGPHTWRGRLLRFGERLFGHKRGQRWMLPAEGEDIRLEKLRAAEEARHEHNMEKLIGAYEYSRAGSSRQPSPLPSLRDVQRRRSPPREQREEHYPAERLEHDSLYSQVTGLPRRAPEPRQPVRNAAELLPSRFSNTTYSSWETLEMVQPAKPPTPAQEYARSVAQAQAQEEAPRGAYWLQPTNTGSSHNPFRK
ncbi:hypothetical protein A0H81_04911 [Grifola frondosa]|uniref:EGF-like domain-containing protein n=1 Tax=Grifola frondosa TaxID=5627 RepID=A0A1C7MF00_GRIFR|nr:hypothetical protein A0H81_04911 [Grifola frondosa]